MSCRKRKARLVRRYGKITPEIRHALWGKSVPHNAIANRVFKIEYAHGCSIAGLQ